MFCSNLTRCFGSGNPPPSDHPKAGGGVAPAIPGPPEVGSIQRSRPYQDLSYEVAPGGAPGNWTECPLGEVALPAAGEPFPTEGNGDRRSLLGRIRSLCSREKTPEELEIEMLRKERKELRRALKGFGIDVKQLNPDNIKNIRADFEQAIRKELNKLEEQQPEIEMQEMKSIAVPQILPTLETNVDDVLPPLNESPTVDYPLTQPDPVGDGGKVLSWKLATPIALPDIV